MESELVRYYKGRVLMMFDQMQINEFELRSLRQEQTKQIEAVVEEHKEGGNIKDEMQKVEDKMKETMAMYEGMVADITRDNIKEREESQARLKELKSLIKAEVSMYELIIARLQATNAQLHGEIGDLKKIIKVPRIHYKHIENLGLDDIKNQYDKINKKMEAQKKRGRQEI